MWKHKEKKKKLSLIVRSNVELKYILLVAKFG